MGIPSPPINEPMVRIFSFILFACLSPVWAQDPELRFGGQISPEVDLIYERGLEWLAQAQGESGEWRDNQAGQGVNGLCVMAFLAGGEDPNYGRWAQPIRRGLRAILKGQDEKTGYIGESMYHHGFALLSLAEAYGAIDETLLWQGTPSEGRSLGKAIRLAVDCAATAQKANRLGGWRYSPTSTDADTSVTGAILMGLFAARNAGLEVADETVNAALEYMRRCTGRDGFVAYSGGFGGMGESMNRTAIATLVAAVSKQKDEAKFPATVKHLTTRLDHRESSYAEYFRYYMAQALFQSDYAAWQKWNAQTVRLLHETQAENGSFANSSYSTAMSLLAVALNYRFLPIYER
jgi:hypothetical protein